MLYLGKRFSSIAWHLRLFLSRSSLWLFPVCYWAKLKTFRQSLALRRSCTWYILRQSLSSVLPQSQLSQPLLSRTKRHLKHSRDLWIFAGGIFFSSFALMCVTGLPWRLGSWLSHSYAPFWVPLEASSLCLWCRLLWLQLSPCKWMVADNFMFWTTPN